MRRHASAPEVRADLANEIGALLQNAEFIQGLSGHLLGDEASQARVPLIRDRSEDFGCVILANRK